MNLIESMMVKNKKITKEDTIKKRNGKWVNRGDDGTEHGEFNTKKEADAQRKAMFAQGYKAESYTLDDEVTLFFNYYVDEYTPDDSDTIYQEIMDKTGNEDLAQKVIDALEADYSEYFESCNHDKRSKKDKKKIDKEGEDLSEFLDLSPDINLNLDAHGSSVGFLGGTAGTGIDNESLDINEGVYDFDEDSEEDQLVYDHLSQLVSNEMYISDEAEQDFMDAIELLVKVYKMSKS